MIVSDQAGCTPCVVASISLKGMAAGGTDRYLNKISAFQQERKDGDV